MTMTTGETDYWRWETDESGIRLTDKVEDTDHRFAEGSDELAYLGPFDVCPEDVAMAVEDITGKPVK